MLIAETQIAYWGVTWEKKSESIGKMAEALNIHPNSIVFIDDSEFEISEVKSAYPGIQTILVENDRSSFLEKLANTGLFQLTRQNSTRTIDLKVPEVQTKEIQDSHFRVEVKQAPLKLEHLDRAASLVNKTNQFNLTSNRSSRSKLWDLTQNPDSMVMVYEVEENSQSKGIMSVLVVNGSSGALRIDDWVLSCRAFSRGIEWWILGDLGRLLASKEIYSIKCELRKTDRTSYIEKFIAQLRDANLIDLDHNLNVKAVLESELLSRKIKGIFND
jgi:FkbH-like protein